MHSTQFSLISFRMNRILETIFSLAPSLGSNRSSNSIISRMMNEIVCVRHTVKSTIFARTQQKNCLQWGKFNSILLVFGTVDDCSNRFKTQDVHTHITMPMIVRIRLLLVICVEKIGSKLIEIKKRRLNRHRRCCCSSNGVGGDA